MHLASQVNTLLAIVEVPSSSKTSLHAKREGGIGQMIEYPIHITEYSIHADKTRSLCPARKRAWHLREYNACSNTRAAQHRASSPHEKPAAAQSRKSLLSGPWVSAPGYTNLLSRRSSHRGVGLHWGKPGPSLPKPLVFCDRGARHGDGWGLSLALVDHLQLVLRQSQVPELGLFGLVLSVYTRHMNRTPSI